MKKIILIIMVMFSFAIVNAEEIVNVRLEWVPNVYYNYEKDGLNYWGQFAYIYAGDNIAYCLDISKNINSTIYTKSDETQNSNLVVVAGYFGYGYEGNISLKDYMATQKLIWGFLGTKVHFTTKSNGEGEPIDIYDNELRIKYKINNHATFPSYDSEFKFIIGSSNNILQKNSINNGYSILNNTDNIIEFSDNGILFNANEIGSNDFYLETNYVKRFDNEIYIADNSQKIMVIGGIKNLKRKYSYEVVGGTLNIKLSYNKNINEANIEDNLFEIYNENDELIGIYSPDINGNIQVNKLKLGKYKIKELNISEGYNVSEYENSFEITEDSLNQIREVYLYPKTINVTINKTFSNTLIGDLNYDVGVVYKIFDFNNNYINELKINENGNAMITLEYGNYKIVQSNINRINIYHEDIIVDTTMFDNDLIFNVHDNISEAKIKILALNKKTNAPISNLNFKINNEERITNSDGIYITESLNFGTYRITDIIKDGYIEYGDFEYRLDKTNKYYVFENCAYVDLIIYLDEVKENENNSKEDNDTENKEDGEITNDTENKEDGEITNDTENKEDDEITNDIENKEDDEISNNIDNQVNESDVNISNNDKNTNEESNSDDEEIINIKNDSSLKLPFLGEDIRQNEKRKIYNYINYLFNFNWLFFIRK